MIAHSVHVDVVVVEDRDAVDVLDVSAHSPRGIDGQAGA